MSIQLTKNIFNKPPSSPLPSWIFRVYFYYTGNNGVQNEFGFELNKDSDISNIPIKADLPSFETHVITQKFFGSEKSFPLLRKYGGETTLEFYIHSTISENDFIIQNFIRDYSKAFINGENNYFHYEFKKAFDDVEIEVYNKKFNKIFKYKLKNCIPVKFDEGSLNYESDEILKYSLTLHYDDWYLSTYDNDGMINF